MSDVRRSLDNTDRFEMGRIQICLLEQGRYICCFEHRWHQALTQQPIEELDQELIGKKGSRTSAFFKRPVDIGSLLHCLSGNIRTALAISSPAICQKLRNIQPAGAHIKVGGGASIRP